MINPLTLRPKAICVLVPPATPDEVKLEMARAAAEVAGQGWWVRTGSSPSEIEIARAAGSKGVACFLSDKAPPEELNLITPKNLESGVVDSTLRLFHQVRAARKPDAPPIPEKHWYRAVEQLLALGGSQLNYTTSARVLLTWWPEKRSSWTPTEEWPLAVEAVHFAQTSPEFPFSANIVNLDRKKWEQSLYVEVPELRERMSNFSLSEIDNMTVEDANRIPF